MRIIISIAFFLITSNLQSQEITKIIKNVSIEGDKTFISRDYVAQKLYFEKFSLVGLVNLSYNGWQILDSTKYRYTDSLICWNKFHPTYIVASKKISSYKTSKDNCTDRNDANEKSIKINDAYGLSDVYIKDINLLISFKPTKTPSGFRFKKYVIPSILIEFGIPPKAHLQSFSYSLTRDSNLLESDCFVFESYKVTRTYHYANKILSEVFIEVKNSTSNTVRKFKHKFKIV